MQNVVEPSAQTKEIQITVPNFKKSYLGVIDLLINQGDLR